jgi:D-methionine transport system substrate-binding protein
MKKGLWILFFLVMLIISFVGSQALLASVVLKVGASPTPHAEILAQIKPLLSKEGIDLQIIEFQDYVQPNLALAEGELNANFFQHVPYLTEFSHDHKLDLTYIAKVHIEPMGIYSKKIKSLKELGNKATVAIPNDPTNGGRALLLLQNAKLITLRKDAGLSATELDIVKNPKGLQVKPLEAAQLPRTLTDVDVAVINTNYALPANLIPAKDALFIENNNSPYANILAVRAKDKNNPALKKLAKALTSKTVKDFILTQYKGSIVPVF